MTAEGQLLHASRLAETAAYFDSAAPAWDSRSHFRTDAVRRVLAETADPAGLRVLDVGCGTGVLFPVLLELRAKHVTGIDLSKEMALRARRKFSEEKRVTVLHGDVHSLTGEWELITVYNAYPHFQERRAFVQQAYDLLAPGGRLLVFHDLGRERLNACHHRSAARWRVSSPLLTCEEELVNWKDLFEINASLDEESLYVLSGTKM